MAMILNISKLFKCRNVSRVPSHESLTLPEPDSTGGSSPRSVAVSLGSHKHLAPGMQVCSEVVGCSQSALSLSLVSIQVPLFWGC